MRRSFESLPVEVILNIIQYLEYARDLFHLSVTCRLLHKVATSDGYRIFVQGRFPSLQDANVIPDQRTLSKQRGSWSLAARDLTSLSIAWDCKTICARPISLPSNSDPSRSSRTGRGMGYTPVISSLNVASEKHNRPYDTVVAWGAGPSLVIGIGDQYPSEYDHGQSTFEWHTQRRPGLIDGKDDIVYVQLAPGTGAEQRLLVGRANAALSCLTLDHRNGHHRLERRFDTLGQIVRSAHLNSLGLLAACLSDDSVALYDVEGKDALSSSENGDAPRAVHRVPGLLQSGKRTWTTCFLRPDRLAIGLGPDQRPTLVYDLTRDMTYHRPSLDIDTAKSTSIYAIEPLPESSNASTSNGNVYLSGAFDGVVRLHDLRTPHSVVNAYTDPVDSSAIYSLLAIGRERFIAGGAMHSLIKIFDLRMPGERRYFALDIFLPSSSPQSRLTSKQSNASSPHQHSFSNFNIFLGTCYRPTPSRMSLHTSRQARSTTGTPRRTRRDIDSPVYSLSAPDTTASSFFAGIEGEVVQINLGVSDLLAAQKDTDLLRLSGYEQTEGAVKLISQGDWNTDADRGRWNVNASRSDWDL